MQGIELWFRDLLITSETQDLNFVGGGLFLESSLPPSFVSLISCSIRNDSIGISSWFDSASRFCCFYNNVSLRKPDFVKRNKKKRGDLDGFLSVSLSIKGSSELTGNDRDNKSFEEEEEVGYENDDVDNKEKLQGSGAINTTKHLWSGAVAAIVSRTIVAPLERLKLEYIVLGEQKHLFELIKTIATNQGLKGFWKGNFVNILRTAPFKAVNFYAYDTYRKKLLKISGNEETTNFEKFLAGAAAGITATILCLPMDTIRTKMVAPGGEALGGVIGAFSHMIHTEGFFSLYKGLVPSILSVAPSGAVFYGVYDILKSAYLHSPEGRKRIQQMNEEGQELNAFEQMELGPMRTLLYGAIAGTCAEAATYPFEVVRRQLQMQVQATKLNALATCAQIVEQRGVAALYAGLTPSLLQVLPSAAISYFVYEFMKIVLKVE
ncbi:Mitochondrial carrier protein coac2 [Thalictrum thalictroides]|uniref:Mitochondrial carrier protein coac2 n=1 Tax=Thalictrum thalictroides TaxID=46969 RepID=A0A7J6X9V9_THATH|nr:Mitochondrial carrier protein coac2 [Thalictrum thalictroides]